MREDKKEIKKQCYATVISEIKFGIAVKIGCQLFITKPDGLGMLIDYYNGQLPHRYKNMESFAYIPESELECDAPTEDKEPVNLLYSTPNFIDKDQGARIIRAIGGWIIIKKGNAMAIFTKKELIKRLTEVAR